MKRHVFLAVLMSLVLVGCIKDEPASRPATAVGGTWHAPVAIDGVEWLVDYRVKIPGVEDPRQFPVKVVAADVGPHVRLLPSGPWLEMFTVLAGEMQLPNPFLLPLDHASLNPMGRDGPLAFFSGGGDEWVLEWSTQRWSMTRTMEAGITIIRGEPQGTSMGPIHIQFKGLPWQHAVFTLDDAEGQRLAELRTSHEDEPAISLGHGFTHVGLGNLTRILDIDETLFPNEQTATFEIPYDAHGIKAYSWANFWCEARPEGLSPLDDDSRLDVEYTLEAQSTTIAGTWRDRCTVGDDSFQYGDACHLNGAGTARLTMSGDTSPLEQVALRVAASHFEWDRTMWGLDAEGRLAPLDEADLIGPC